MIEGGVHTHIVTSRFAVPLLIDSAKKSGGGLIVEVTDGDSYQYRGNLFYGLAVTTSIRMAFVFARELRRKNVAAVALTPGFLRSEVMLEHLGVTEVNWREGSREGSGFCRIRDPRVFRTGGSEPCSGPEAFRKIRARFSLLGHSLKNMASPMSTGGGRTGETTCKKSAAMP